MRVAINISQEKYNEMKDRVERLPFPEEAEEMIVNGIILQEEGETGYWMHEDSDGSITCDKCGCLIWANDIQDGDAHYCPNCGERKVGEKYE